MRNLTAFRHNFGGHTIRYSHSTTPNNPVDLERMIRLLNPSSEDVALDIATGTGSTALKLAEYVKQVVGIDITPEMLAHAKEAALYKEVWNVDFREQDAHCLNTGDSQFDIVSCRFGTHNFDDPRVALKEMCRVLKPGGKLYILDSSVTDGDETENEINRIEFLRDSSHVFSYSPRIWKEILEEYPLKLERLELLRDQYPLPEWFDRMGLSQSKREEIIWILDSLSEEHKLQYPFSDDYITTYRIEILASKI